MKFLKVAITIIAIGLLTFNQVGFAIPLPNTSIQGSDIAGNTITPSNIQCQTSGSGTIIAGEPFWFGSINGGWEITDVNHYHYLTSIDVGSLNLCTGRNYTLTVYTTIYGYSCTKTGGCQGEFRIGLPQINTGSAGQDTYDIGEPAGENYSSVSGGCSVGGSVVATCSPVSITIYGYYSTATTVPIYFDDYFQSGSTNDIQVQSITWSIN